MLGLDISYWNNGTSSTGTSQANWNTAYNTPDANGYTRHFAWVRASRGGTTGLSQTSGTPFGHTSQETLSRRYDDPRFVQNITRAVNAGLMAGPYHFGRPDIAGNTGTDEANHFIQAAGAWMRPGYLMPVFDLEAGTSNLGQFSLDFSNRLYEVMGIRPGMYINGNHTNYLVNSSNSAQLAAMAQPAANGPSVVGPAYPMLWNARYANQDNPNSIPVQTGNPRTTPTTINSYYGPWDDYGDSQPWAFWQYASTVSIPGLNAVDSTMDGNVAQGDLEFVRNYLVPAVWMNNSSGDWSTLANWNSGQTPAAPITGPGQTAPYMTGNLPTPRLPGAAGSGPTSGQYDTVILERPSANITVTVSTGSHNVRKLYMRETLNITGGTLSINYDPTYRPDNSATVRHGGPVSAQFSGSVTLSGSGALNVHTLQVDANRTFTLSGGSLAFNTINLMPLSSTPAKIVVNGNASIAPLGAATATIARGTGTGNNPSLDMAGGVRTLTVANGSAAVDLSINVPVANGGFTLDGPGTVELKQASTFSGGVNVTAGRLLVNNASGTGTGSSNVAVSGAGRLGGTGSIYGMVTAGNGGRVAPGISAGALTAGWANFQAGSALEIELAGLTPGTQYDKLVVTGTATLAGTLDVSLLGGFAPQIGQSFTILTAPTITGEFNTLVAPTLAEGTWRVTYDANAVVLSVEDAPPIPGDFNADGSVDGDDLAAWQTGYGTAPGAGLDNGDADGDGAVDGADFLVWQRNVTAPGAVAANTAVPEPAAWLLGTLAAATMAGIRRKR